MKYRDTRRVPYLLISLVFLIAGCGGGGTTGESATNPSPGNPPPPVSKTLTWSPPNAYQDNTPLDPAQDLAGYNIYIKLQGSSFTDTDPESAFAAPADTSLNLVPVCELLGLPPGSYVVSVRAIAKNGLMSDFSSAAPFTL